MFYLVFLVDVAKLNAVTASAIIPVSYTHLDVYKRQPWHIGNVEIKNRIVQCSMGGTSIFGWMEPNHFDKEAATFLLERAKNNVEMCIRDRLRAEATICLKYAELTYSRHKLRAYLSE